MSASQAKIDRELVEQVKKGSQEAFEELVTKYETKVFNLAMRFTRNQEDAEEVLQDVFCTIHRKINLFQGKSAFSSWMYRIVVNAAFMKLRKRRQNKSVLMEDLSPSVKQQCLDGDPHQSDFTDQFTLKRELGGIIKSAVDRLPEQYRSVFVLRDINGMSNQEVAEVLQLSIPAVKSRLHRSRLMLRKKLQRYYTEFTGCKARMDAPPISANA